METRALHLLFMLNVCLFSCIQYEKEHRSDIILHLDRNVQENILFSSFVDSITYIPLETTEESLLGEIRDIIISDYAILVLPNERTSIYLFDKNGKFLRKIKRIGAGPGEYRYINQMSFNPKRNSIAVASDKIIEYDLFGNLKNEFAIPFYVTDLHLFDNGDYLLSRMERTEDPEDVVIRTDSAGKLKQNLLKRNPLYKIWDTHFWELIEYDDEIHLISPQLENDIYILSDDTLKKKISFRIDPEVPSDFYTTKPDVWGVGKHYYRTVYRETKNWIHLVFWSQTKGTRRILYDKKNRRYTVGKNYKNDMDNKIQIGYLSAAEENTLTNLVEPENEEDNPVIQILYLKH